MDLPGVAVQSCDAGCGCGVDAVVLASSTAGEFMYSDGRGDGNVEHDFTDGKEPQCEVVSEAVGIFDGPASVRPGFGPADQAFVFGDRGVDADRAEVGVGSGVQGCRSVSGFVRIETDDDHGVRFPSLGGWGIRGGQSDFKYLSQQLVVMPLSSHTANADRWG